MLGMLTNGKHYNAHCYVGMWQQGISVAFLVALKLHLETEQFYLAWKAGCDSGLAKPPWMAEEREEPETFELIAYTGLHHSAYAHILFFTHPSQEALSAVWNEDSWLL